MSLPELATIMSQGLPIKIIVMNNGYLGMVRQWQELFYNNRLSSVTLDTFPDAESSRQHTASRAARLRTRVNFATALETAVAEPGPYLLNMKVTPFENVYPMVPAGGAINEMVLGPPQPVAVGGSNEHAADYFDSDGEQARRADARHRVCSPSAITTSKALPSLALWTRRFPG